MASKQKANPQPTRSSSRIKTPPTQTASTIPTRTTRAKAAAATKAVVAPTTTTTTAKRATGRKTLLEKDNSVDVKPSSTRTATGFPKPAKPLAASTSTQSSSDSDREPIMAYLRIRPHLAAEEPTSLPYLEHLSDTTVRMTDPNHDNNANQSRPRYRLSTVAPSSLYTFSHIFQPTTAQSDFFTKTTLPLVRNLLDGQNALLFTYGVTNSGKTYTVQGGTRQGSAGILPRTLDVIFNSIEGLHSDGRYRPVRLHGIERAEPSDAASPRLDLDVTADEPALAEVLAEHLTNSASETDIDPTALKLDRNYEYSVWLSYAEVYNEKAYDLLDSVHNDDDGARLTKSGLPRPASALPNQTHPLLLTRKALSVKPSPASDVSESAGASATTSTGKYIAGLRQFRVQSASQAKALVKLGQLHRRVFGTLANSQSSRSHGLVTIKVVRGHRGERDDPTSLQVSRLTLVDLAGSERTKHTHTTGDRLKEAGSINKSLMVLGQCMEVMRANQKRVAQSLAGAPRTDTRDVKRGLAVVPFRHSKLTEVLMDYFVGDGKAVMIVNVNPYDTGFDENSHVMKFAALAREVYTTPAHAPIQRVLPSSPTKAGTAYGSKFRNSATGKHIEFAPVRRQVTISTGGPGRKFSEAHLEVLEEDEEIEETGDDDDDEPINPLVDALFDEVENLRLQLFESEMRCAIIEAETREEVMKEMEERMRSVERMYARRLMNEVEQNEMKTDAKIDMLHKSGLFGKGVSKPKTRKSNISEDTEDDEEVDFSMSIQNDESTSGEELVSESDGGSATGTDASRSPSPLAAKTKGKNVKQPREIRQSVPDGPECLPLPSDYSEDDVTDTEDDGTEIFSQTTENTDDEEEDEEEDWVPPIAPTPKPRASKTNTSRFSSASAAEPASAPLGTAKGSSKDRISKLAREMKDMSLHAESDSDLSAYILPSKKTHQGLVTKQDSDVEDNKLATVKSKKRQLAKKPVVMGDVEQTPMRGKNSGSGRNSRKTGGN